MFILTISDSGECFPWWRVLPFNFLSFICFDSAQAIWLPTLALLWMRAMSKNITGWGPFSCNILQVKDNQQWTFESVLREKTFINLLYVLFQRIWYDHVFCLSSQWFRILAWRDFPLVTSLTFWRMNGVTSLPVIPTALIKSKKEQKVIISAEMNGSVYSQQIKKPQRHSAPRLCYCSLYGFLYLLAGCCMLLWDGHR